MSETLLKIENLSVEYRVAHRWIPAVRDLSLELRDGECLALVGESGSGKSTVAKACLGLLEENGRITGGSITIGGVDVALLRSERDWRRAGIRGKRVSMVLQDPGTALDPTQSVGSQISESYRINHRGCARRLARQVALDILRDSGFADPKQTYRAYPCQLSGGMLQRAAIGMAVACGAKVVILDECTSSLDVTTQAEILDTLRAFSQRFHISLLLITHDMGVVAKLADRIAVMYAGQLMEIGACEEIFFDPRHPYTWTLFASLPQLCGGKYVYRASRRDAQALPAGDAFAPVNPYTVLEIDRVAPPPLFRVSDTHFARTWLLDPRAPRVSPPECLRDLKNLKPYGRDLDGMSAPAEG